MDRDIDPLELLALWWRHERQWTPVQGFPSECPSMRDYRTSRQYDSENGAFDVDATGRLVRHIEGVIHGIDEPYRTTLYFIARNHCTNANVWKSARLPADPDALADLVSDALNEFIARI